MRAAHQPVDWPYGRGSRAHAEGSGRAEVRTSSRSLPSVSSCTAAGPPPSRTDAVNSAAIYGDRTDGGGTVGRLAALTILDSPS